MSSESHCHGALTPQVFSALGAFAVRTPEGTVKVARNRPDIASGLATGVLRDNRRTALALQSPEAAAARARAKAAVSRADSALARSAPKVEPPALTAAQSRAIDALPNSGLLAAVGALLGRELARRDQRLRALELRLPRDEGLVRQRAREALQRIREALA